MVNPAVLFLPASIPHHAALCWFCAAPRPLRGGRGPPARPHHHLRGEASCPCPCPCPGLPLPLPLHSPCPCPRAPAPDQAATLMPCSCWTSCWTCWTSCHCCSPCQVGCGPAWPPARLPACLPARRPACPPARPLACPPACLPAARCLPGLAWAHLGSCSAVSAEWAAARLGSKLWALHQTSALQPAGDAVSLPPLPSRELRKPYCRALYLPDRLSKLTGARRAAAAPVQRALVSSVACAPGLGCRAHRPRQGSPALASPSHAPTSTCGACALAPRLPCMPALPNLGRPPAWPGLGPARPAALLPCLAQGCASCFFFFGVGGRRPGRGGAP
jgi:hypothetical protein